MTKCKCEDCAWNTSSLAVLHLLFFSLDAVFICQQACECEQKDLDACSISVVKRDCGFRELISICCPCFFTSVFWTQFLLLDLIFYLIGLQSCLSQAHMKYCYISTLDGSYFLNGWTECRKVKTNDEHILTSMVCWQYAGPLQFRNRSISVCWDLIRCVHCGHMMEDDRWEWLCCLGDTVGEKTVMVCYLISSLVHGFVNTHAFWPGEH